jgi:hypothetical protein
VTGPPQRTERRREQRHQQRERAAGEPAPRGRRVGAARGVEQFEQTDQREQCADAKQRVFRVA